MDKWLKRLRVEELYGLYDYDFIIPEGQSVSIITGPNGYGKTTLLSILNHIYAGSFWYFLFLIFRGITVEFSDNHSLIIVKHLISDSESLLDDGATDSSLVTVSFYEEGKPIEEFSITNEYLSEILRSTRQGLEWPRRQFSDYDILQYEYHLDNDVYMQNEAKNTLLFLSNHPYKFVRARRLEASSNDFKRSDDVSFVSRRKVMTVELISDEIGQDFKKAQQEFAEKSQRIDASFYKRLLSSQEEIIELSDCQTKLENLKRRIQDYSKFRLVPNIEIEDSEIKESNKKVLSLYLKDMETKMDSFSEYYKQLIAFDSFVKSCVLSDKTMAIGEWGIEITNDIGKRIPLNKLSDGEQDLLILGYYLYYASKDNTLLLIDEPENSLHMAWLENMLEAFENSAKLRNIQIIVATHSPAFINGRWGLTFDLYANRLLGGKRGGNESV